MIDLWTGRRDFHLECVYYSQIRENNIVPNNQIVYSNVATGTFYAKEVSAYYIQNQQIENSFLAEQVSLTIYTRDDIKDLKRNDKVVIDGEEYRVADIQVIPVKKQRAFVNRDFASNGYYIALKK